MSQKGQGNPWQDPVYRTEQDPSSSSAHLKFTGPPPAYTAREELHLDPAEEQLNPTNHDFKILEQVDSILVIDDSESMGPGFYSGQDREIDIGRMEEMATAVADIAPKLARDQDGIDLYFLNNVDRNKKGVKSSNEVHDALKGVVPRNGTPIGNTLKTILDPYWEDYRDWSVGVKHVKPVKPVKRLLGSLFKKNTDLEEPPKRPKPLNIIIITDGHASDEEELKKVIYQSMLNIHLYEAPPRQVGMFFFQMGNPDDIKVKDEHLKTKDQRRQAEYKYNVGAARRRYKASADAATDFLVKLDDKLRQGFLKWLSEQRTGDGTRIERTRALEKSILAIDEDLGLDIYDIVDTTKLNELGNRRLNANGIAKVVLGGLSDGMDRESKGLHS
ncbi:hypothetical protein F5Y16DRAFT_300188 [Xylariaceae sp. FL0255]|nr:hypothetical protein F5Y16DRAFT_300188 [Xylariaceae sp. FL0255]